MKKAVWKCCKCAVFLPSADDDANPQGMMNRMQCLLKKTAFQTFWGITPDCGRQEPHSCLMNIYHYLYNVAINHPYMIGYLSSVNQAICCVNTTSFKLHLAKEFMQPFLHVLCLNHVPFAFIAKSTMPIRCRGSTWWEQHCIALHCIALPNKELEAKVLDWEQPRIAPGGIVSCLD